MGRAVFLAVAVWAILISSVPVHANIVSIQCECDAGLPYEALQTASFDYDSQVLTTTDVFYKINPEGRLSEGDLLRIHCRADSPSTITVIKHITNKTDIVWTSYAIQNTPPMVESGVIVDGSASSTKLSTIVHHPTEPIIEFFAPEPVFPGESFTVQFEMHFEEYWYGFMNVLNQNAVPEPTTIALLAFGGLAFLTKRRG